MSSWHCSVPKMQGDGIVRGGRSCDGGAAGNALAAEGCQLTGVPCMDFGAGTASQCSWRGKASL